MHLYMISIRWEFIPYFRINDFFSVTGISSFAFKFQMFQPSIYINIALNIPRLPFFSL